MITPASSPKAARTPLGAAGAVAHQIYQVPGVEQTVYICSKVYICSTDQACPALLNRHVQRLALCASPALALTVLQLMAALAMVFSPLAIWLGGLLLKPVNSRSAAPCVDTCSMRTRVRGNGRQQLEVAQTANEIRQGV